LGPNYQFGGGATASTMSPIVLALMLLAALGILFLPKKYALSPLLVVAFLTPNQQLLVGGFHFFATRLIILAGLIRIIRTKRSRKSPMLGGGLQAVDKAIFALALVHAFTFILQFRDSGAITYQIAFLLDVCGGYFLFRYFIQDQQDVLQITKTLGVVATVLAVCMGYEYLTRINVFSYINSYTIVPWVRDGRVRAQGTFTNSITAGTFGATLFPLFFWLWKSGKSRLLGATALAASSVIAITSMASTGVTAYAAGILALCLWPIRKYMRSIRWGIIVAVLGLALAMKAPVWFIIARIDLVGGHGWDRAVLIDLAVKHFSEWWLLGTKDNATWGADTWDACNEFVYQATSAGLLAFALFIFILSRSFGAIGKARKRVEGRRLEWFYWSLGAVLFAHSMGFWGIDYFDVIRLWWYLFLAMIPASILAAQVPKTEHAKAVRASNESSLIWDEKSQIVEPADRQPEHVPVLKEVI
jgi:hypothetical protein